jgi:hypothetical protein
MKTLHDFMDFLDHLASFLGNSEGQTLEEIKRDVEEMGVDFDGVMKRTKKTVELKLNELKRQTLDQARDERLKKDATFRDRLDQFKGLRGVEKLSRMRDLLEAGGMSPSLAYRGLSRKDDKDLASLSEDAELARIIANEQKPR